MECYIVKVPEGRRLAGLTTAGKRVPILPGEYHVHRMARRSGTGGVAALRFVGAYGPDSDVHISVPDGTDIEKALSVSVEAVDDGAD